MAPINGPRCFALLTAFGMMALPTGSAFADGVYVSESFGDAHASSDGARYVANSLQARIALGLRRQQWALEVWGKLPGNECFDCAGPDGGVTSIGLDAKYILPLLTHLEGYVFGGIAHGYGSGALAGYNGRGVGGGVGLQLKGKVSVYDLCTVSAALYIDNGIDLLRLNRASDGTVDVQFKTIRLGVALGSDF